MLTIAAATTGESDEIEKTGARNALRAAGLTTGKADKILKDLEINGALWESSKGTYRLTNGGAL